MQCPKCPGAMSTRTYGKKILIQQCERCGGMFCKPEVLLEMKREWMSEVVLDVGDPNLGKEYDKIEDINCPACGIMMDKRSDTNQTHIWFESCGQCSGIFLDAGEFSDLKYDTFMDRIRDMLKGKRGEA